MYYHAQSKPPYILCPDYLGSIVLSCDSGSKTGMEEGGRWKGMRECGWEGSVSGRGEGKRKNDRKGGRA